MVVPKFPSIPRLSIIVPIGRSLAAFEGTLISVLENQPPGCEIIVATDGNYDDPHELCDEVRFVVGTSSSMVDLVAAGAEAARGRFVHVLADGIEATCGWIDGAIEKFEQIDVGVVAPVIRHAASNEVVAAGWCDGSDRLCKAADEGRNRIGAYLHASFWRREVLRSMTDAFAASDDLEATYAYDFLIRAAGWRCVLAAESNLRCGSDDLPWEKSSFTRGKQLRAIRGCFGRSNGWANSLLGAGRALVSCVIQPGLLAEACGQAIAPIAKSGYARRLKIEAVKSCSGDSMILSMPKRDVEMKRQTRRAA